MYHSHGKVNTGKLSVSTRTLKAGYGIITWDVNTLVAQAIFVLFLINKFHFLRVVLGLQKIEQKVQRFSHIPFLLSPHLSWFPLLWSPCIGVAHGYDWWTDAETKLLMVHGIHLGSFFVLHNSMGFVKCIMSSVHHFSITQQFHCPKNPLCPTYA